MSASGIGECWSRASQTLRFSYFLEVGLSLDRHYPPERNAEILRDARAAGLIIEAANVGNEIWPSEIKTIVAGTSMRQGNPRRRERREAMILPSSSTPRAAPASRRASC